MEKKEKLVLLAKELLGKPYKYSAKPEEAPNFFDCSSFVQYLYKQIGIDLPRTALEQASKGKKINSFDKLDIGDLIFIKGGWGHYNPDYPEGIGHVAMYIGDRKSISARYNEKDGGKVIEETVDDYLQRDDLRAIRRII